MAKNGTEPTASMGADIPLAVLSEKHQPLFYYFKQMFAQVTNPPIDALREAIVTDTTVYAGSDGNLLSDCAENCRVLQINNPVLTSRDLMKIEGLHMPGLQSKKVSLLYYKNASLALALDRLFVACDKAYYAGQISSFSPTAVWMRTTSPSRLCWQCPPCSSILSARKSARRSP